MKMLGWCCRSSKKMKNKEITKGSSYHEKSWIPMSSRGPEPFLTRGDMISYTAEDLCKMTNGFSEEMVLGTFDFGLIYKGRTTRTNDDNDAQIDVTVKVWKLGGNLNADLKQHCLSSLRNEIELLTRPGISHSYLPKIVGRCWDNDMMGVVYHVKALGILGKIFDRDDFVWTERVLVALRVAVLLNYLHSCEPPFLVRNLSANHILLDEFKNPIIFEFSMLTGGFLQQDQGGMADELLGQCNFVDSPVLDSGDWSETSDVHEFGFILLGLLRSYELRGDLFSGYDVDGKTWYSYKKCKRYNMFMFCLTHRSFRSQLHFHRYDGHKISKLALRCLDTVENDRPTFEEIIDRLRNLYMFTISQVVLFPLEGFSLVEFSFEELAIVTGDFSEGNSICRVQFGVLYKGQIQKGFKGLESQDVVVKTWVIEAEAYGSKSKEYIRKLKDEMLFLRHPRFANNPSLPKLLGFCCEDGNKFGIVYKLKAVTSPRSVMSQGSFRWVSRLKSMYQLACLLQVLHNNDPRHVVGNLSSDHILLDEDYNMVLVDFGMMTGGMFGSRKISEFRNYPLGATGYIDIRTAFTGSWGPIVDVFVFGKLMTQMFSSALRVSVGDTTRLEILKNGSISSILDDNFRSDDLYEGDDAEVVVKIAYYCQCCREKRLTINEIVVLLENLKFLNPLKSLC